MALTDGQKHLAAFLVQRNPDPDYMIKLSEDPEFVIAEVMANAHSIFTQLSMEKDSHESHILVLQARLANINVLLDALKG